MKSTDAKCPICGGVLKWDRIGDTDMAHAECQDGLNVSRRAPNAGLPCLWTGGKVHIVDDAGGTAWIGEPPRGLYAARDLWIPMTNEPTEYILRARRPGSEGAGNWYLMWSGIEAVWRLIEIDMPQTPLSASRPAPGTRLVRFDGFDAPAAPDRTEPPFTFATAMIREKTKRSRKEAP